MKILALDVSIRTGGAVFDTDSPKLLIDAFNIDYKKKSPLSSNRMEKPAAAKVKKRNGITVKRNTTKYDPSNHPQDFISFVEMYTDEVYLKIKQIYPKVVVIEQTNKGRDRWRQKLLEWIHLTLIKKIYNDFPKEELTIHYLDTIEWHRILNMKLSKEDRKQNKDIRIHNKNRKEGESIARGLTDDKDLAIRFVKETFGYDLMMKENDIADAICMGCAYLVKIKELEL